MEETCWTPSEPSERRYVALAARIVFFGEGWFLTIYYALAERVARRTSSPGLWRST